MTPFGRWLAEIGLGRHEQIFVSNEIDFDVIGSLLCGVHCPELPVFFLGPKLCPFQFVVAGVWRGSLLTSSNLEPEGKVT
jgi:hypothetical protein